MTLMSHVSTNPDKYGDIYVAFVPDEEIGLRGAKVMDLTRFPVDFAYTIDCCQLGEVVYETFNAASVDVKIKGFTAHPMSAKNVLVSTLCSMMIPFSIGIWLVLIATLFIYWGFEIPIGFDSGYTYNVTPTQ